MQDDPQKQPAGPKRRKRRKGRYIPGPDSPPEWYCPSSPELEVAVFKRRRTAGNPADQLRESADDGTKPTCLESIDESTNPTYPLLRWHANWPEPGQVTEARYAFIWCERVVKQQLASALDHDAFAYPIKIDQPHWKRDIRVGMVSFKNECIYVHPHICHSLRDVLVARVNGAGPHYRVAPGTSLMSLSMVADLLKLEQFFLTKAPPNVGNPEYPLERDFETPDWVTGGEVAEGIGNPFKVIKGYAACLFYLRSHTLCELSKLTDSEHHALMLDMTNRDVRLVLNRIPPNVKDIWAYMGIYNRQL
ncbi:hypothetical protein GE09DRAFT_1222154 [Coniochaeta sp. 2T2.1]|nr:hypothetical protein GE09DRAFT_1222154 [Coniochaeta sp. 2T2.1]